MISSNSQGKFFLKNIKIRKLLGTIGKLAEFFELVLADVKGNVDGYGGIMSRAYAVLRRRLSVKNTRVNDAPSVLVNRVI